MSSISHPTYSSVPMTAEQLRDLKARLIEKGLLRRPGTDKRKPRLNPALMEWAVEDMERRAGGQS